MDTSLGRMALEFQAPSRPCPPSMVTVLFILCKLWFVHGLGIVSWCRLLIYTYVSPLSCSLSLFFICIDT